MNIFKHHINNALPIVLPITWLILFRKTIGWIFNAYVIYENIFGPVILIAIIAIIIFKAKQSDKKVIIIKSFEFRKIPLIIVLGSLILFLFAEYFIGLNILSSVIFGIGTYGMVGFYINEKTWKQGFLPAILIIQTLPFGIQLDTYVGFPLRMFTTEIVTNILSESGIENLKSETIIIIENRASNIDLSCSGMKGLWSGTMFFLIAIWIEKRKINFYTILIFFVLIIMLVGFNIARITSLVIIDTVYNNPELAEMIHLPTGIIGFVFSLLIVWLLLKYKKPSQKEAEPTAEQFKHNSNNQINKLLIYNKNSLTFWLLLTALSGANFLHFEKEHKTSLNTDHNYTFPKNFVIQELPLTSDETKLLISNEKDNVKKIRFDNDTISGSVLISSTGNWRGHHKPELCFKSEGLTGETIQTVMIDKDFDIKKINFRENKQTACYWFQSGDKTCSDFSARVWNAVLGKQTEWTMVSVLFDERYEEAPIINFLKMMKKNFETENQKNI